MRILITGGRGFLGRNLTAHLIERENCEITIFDKEDSCDNLQKWLSNADVIFHLAGVNRPENPAEYETGNAELTGQICVYLRNKKRRPKIVFSSSIQADLNNPYGLSKAKAESLLRKYSLETGAPVCIYRLKNLFGKWCRPNYNSVTATFCHNIANDLPISISDPAHEMELSYVDDVVAAFISEVDEINTTKLTGGEIPSRRIQLGDLAGTIQAYHEMRTTLTLPDFADWFNRGLYATYLSYLPQEARQYNLETKSDARGSLSEFIKQSHLGQLFVSRTKPGVTRGNHFHHTKTEKFYVVEGDGLIRMRSIDGGSVQEYRVTGAIQSVIDIPPGFTHSITNIGTGEMVTLFWSSEIFDPNRPDTHFLPVEIES